MVCFGPLESWASTMRREEMLLRWIYRISAPAMVFLFPRRATRQTPAHLICTGSDRPARLDGICRAPRPPRHKKGAFAGVFAASSAPNHRGHHRRIQRNERGADREWTEVPTCENMWGVLIFLRFYFVVGQVMGRR